MREVQDVCDATEEIEKSTAAIEKSNKSLLVTLNEKVRRYTAINIYTPHITPRISRLKSQILKLTFLS